jgi:putative toxin-antitoxin system antitoxin component (TIGR02293 family)
MLKRQAEPPERGRRRAKPASKQPTARLIAALERGDAIAVYDIIQDGMATNAFGADAVESFLERTIANKDVRPGVRQSLVSERSWKRRKGERPSLSAAEVSRLADVGHVVRQARRLWQDDAVAEKFLTTPHPRLHGREPLQVAASEGGLPAVLELLQRIEEGAPV